MNVLINLDERKNRREAYPTLKDLLGISLKAEGLIGQAESDVRQQFTQIENTALVNQAKVLNAFQGENVALRHFAPTTGYGYDDYGRDTLDKLFAKVFGAQDALVRPQIASGTHALALVLSGLLMPGDELLSATGKPYDTLEKAIGISGDEWGSLKSYGITYCQVEMKEDRVDIGGVLAAINPRTRIVYFQRSRGYEWREALAMDDVEQAVAAVKEKHPHVWVVMDNCYGEFTDILEPTQLGVDIIAGSLIKNPGGGLAPTGGYVAGNKDLIEKISSRLTSPGIGREVGSYAASYAPYYQGLFLAPHTVSQALKGAVLSARVFELLGTDVLPSSKKSRGDIIQSIRFGDQDKLVDFCRTIQKASPVDSAAVPYPWDMPGYKHQVIMAAGAFVQGSSIELSADAPIKPPYIAYMQGGLTYEHVKLALMMAVN